jgi:hypothetical protein
MLDTAFVFFLWVILLRFILLFSLANKRREKVGIISPVQSLNCRNGYKASINLSWSKVLLLTPSCFLLSTNGGNSQEFRERGKREKKEKASKRYFFHSFKKKSIEKSKIWSFSLFYLLCLSKDSNLNFLPPLESKLQGKEEHTTIVYITRNRH